MTQLRGTWGVHHWGAPTLATSWCPARVDRSDLWPRVALIGQVAEGTRFAAQQGPWNHGTDLMSWSHFRISTNSAVLNGAHDDM